MPTKAMCLMAALFASTSALAVDAHAGQPDSHLRAADINFGSNPQWETPPKLLSGRLPIYPISQLLSKNKGVATVRYTIGVDGIPKDIVVEAASDRRFANHAEIALRDWRFQAASMHGSPIEATVRETFLYEPGARYGSVVVSHQMGDAGSLSQEGPRPGK